MDFRVEITADAEAEVDAIVAYIAVDAPDRARQWLLRFYELTNSLDRYPERCGIAPEAKLVDFPLRQL